MTKKRLLGFALATIFALAADQAWAGHHWGSCGSSGGSYGSYGSGGGSYGSCGSSGGSYGSYGSSGGSWGSHGGSWGSHGSSGGSWGSHGSSGGGYGYGSSGGGYGSSGSSGGSYGSYGSYGGGITYYSHAGASYAGAPGTELGPPQVVQRDSRVRFALTVPEDAKVYLVNQPMTVTGAVRHFVTPELPQGKEYKYPIRVEVVRNGTTYAANSEVRVRAGDDINLAFAVQANSQSQVVAARGN